MDAAVVIVTRIPKVEEVAIASVTRKGSRFLVRATCRAVPRRTSTILGMRHGQAPNESAEGLRQSLDGQRLESQKMRRHVGHREGQTEPVVAGLALHGATPTTADTNGMSMYWLAYDMLLGVSVCYA